jgi:hypothetical protein
MKQFIKAFLVFFHMYQHGFFWSESSHVDEDKTYWGFYRLNHKNCPALADIDFSYDSKSSTDYAHLHGDDYRFDYDKSGKMSKILKNGLPEIIWWQPWY